MVVKIIEISGQAVTSDDGVAVLHAILLELKSQKQVELSFAEIHYVTSSFLNASLMTIAEEFGEAKFKSALKVTDANRQVADTIRYRMSHQFPQS